MAELLLALRDYRREVCSQPELLLVCGPALEADFRACEEWIEERWMEKVGLDTYPKDRLTLPRLKLYLKGLQQDSFEPWFALEAGAFAEAYGVPAYCQAPPRDLLRCIERWLEEEKAAESWLFLGADGVRSVELSLQRAALWLKAIR